MTKRTITFDDDLNEINTITLDRELRSRDISAVELELRALAASSTDGNGGGSTWKDDLGGELDGGRKYGQVDYDPNL